MAAAMISVRTRLVRRKPRRGTWISPSSYVDQRMCSLRPTPERVVVFGLMHRVVKFSILLALAGLGTVVFVISAAASKRQPTIQLVTGQTAVKVAGKGFAPGERVTLRATAAGVQYVAKTRASVRGAFMATARRRDGSRDLRSVLGDGDRRAWQSRDRGSPPAHRAAVRHRRTALAVVRARHLAVVERLVEHVLGDTLLPRDLAQRPARRRRLLDDLARLVVADVRIERGRSRRASPRRSARVCSRFASIPDDALLVEQPARGREQLDRLRAGCGRSAARRRSARSGPACRRSRSRRRCRSPARRPASRPPG